MRVTVGDLLAMPHLQLRLHSGAGGIEHQVTWTHTSDLPEPWQWVGPGELLMTNGMSFRAEPDDQVALIDRLVGVGVSALAIGAEMYCPPLSDQLARASEEHEFPVLWIGYPLPFVAISRAVAEATLLEQSERLMRTVRLYDVLHHAAQNGHQRSSVAEALTRELGATVTICDRETGAAYHPEGPHPDAEVAAAVREARSGQSALLTGTRSVALSGGGEVRVADISTTDHAVLVLARPDGPALDGILVQHAATIAALELAQTRLALEHTRRAGAEAAGLILDGQLDARTARRRLRAVGLDPTHCAAVTVGGAPEERNHELHVRLWRAQVPHLLTVRRQLAHVLVPTGDHPITVLTEALGEHGHVGVSAPLRTAGRGLEPGREAVWALGAARQSGVRVHRFGEPTELPGAASLEESQSLVDQVLGPVLRHDVDHQLELLPTLETFLAYRRSWQATANALHVHRQTVLYRMKRIERLTGRDLADTESVALMWLALRARNQLLGRQPLNQGRAGPSAELP